MIGSVILVKFAKIEFGIKFPKHFSKNRFDGKRKNFYSILEKETGLTYNPYHKHRKLNLI
jgi:hypothetical protein